MIGLKIAASGAVMFVFCCFMSRISKKEPVTSFGWVFDLAALAGFFAMPVGLLLAIWI